MRSLAEAVSLIAAARRASVAVHATDGIGCPALLASSSDSDSDSSSVDDSSAERIEELEALLAAKEQYVEEIMHELLRTREELERLSCRHDRQTQMMQMFTQEQRIHVKEIVAERSARAIRRHKAPLQLDSPGRSTGIDRHAAADRARQWPRRRRTSGFLS